MQKVCIDRTHLSPAECVVRLLVIRVISHCCLWERKRSPSTRLFSSRRDQCVANGKIVSLVLHKSSRSIWCFFCVTFLSRVSFISSFSRDLCASQAEEDAEGKA